MPGTTGRVRPHNEPPAAVWNAGGKDYDTISRGIADAIEHCVLRLDPRPGERILDLATGTGWTSRVVARRGAAVIGVDIAGELLDAARGNAEAEGLARVCHAGGRIALTTWLSDSSVLRMFEVMQRYLPRPSASLPSPFEWGRTARLRELLGGAFHLQFEIGVSFYHEPSAEAAWETFSKGYGPTRALAVSLDAERCRALREDFIALHARYATDLGISMPRAYCLTIGTHV